MRRLSRYLLGSVTLLILLGSSNCSQNSDANAPQFVTALTVEDVNNLPSSGFATGATIQFVLSIRNRSNSSQTLWFNTSEMYNFAVVDAGTATVEWNWDASQTFNQNFVSLAFNAGETKTFVVSWNQEDNGGTQVATGSYEVIGGFTVYNTTGAGSAADNGSSMAIGAPTAAQLFPTIYISDLVPFTIQ